MIREPVIPVPLDILWRFWSFVDRKGPEECWNWRKQGKKPYGNFTIFGENYSAHRFSYLIFNGPFDVELLVRHTCDNTRCVNPNHLILGTQKDNKADGVERGRNAKGESHGNSSLRLSQVIQIKYLLKEGVNPKEIAESLSVSESSVRHIKAGDSWAWV